MICKAITTVTKQRCKNDAVINGFCLKHYERDKYGFVPKKKRR